MDNRSDRFAIIQPVLDKRISRQAGNAALDPGVAGNSFGAGNAEVLHQPQRFGVRSKIGMKEAMRAGILVGVAERDFIAQPILLQELKGVAQPDIVIGFWLQAGPH